ncbi:MAG: lytic transglycosylase domain-containing protein [Deltaproteobacteria bacterium]|nr:lytic transglycosylase domain-containing protein [Deltaproteobacteria bacterium]
MIAPFRDGRWGVVRLRLTGALLVSFLASSARAEMYTWVDEQGVLHFEDLPPAKKAVGDRFGGFQPVVEKLPSGEERQYYPADVGIYDEILWAAADHYRLPFPYLKAIAKVESNFNSTAISHANAQGVMQLVPSTARLMGVTDPFDARQSVFGGARYLRILANRFEGDLALTAAAYNAGPERVQRDGGIPAIDETTRYVRRVLQMYRYYAKGRSR